MGKKYLDDLYDEAMKKWSLDELKRTMFQDEMYPKEEHEEYTLIYNLRMKIDLN